MGRGRAKAKQAKVARRLKYDGGGTDLERLRRELGVGDAAADRLADEPGDGDAASSADGPDRGRDGRCSGAVDRVLEG